jgi:hypothetical protein
MRLILFVLLASSLASAQAASLEGPSSGVFYDQPSGTFVPAIIDGWQLFVTAASEPSGDFGHSPIAGPGLLRAARRGPGIDL